MKDLPRYPLAQLPTPITDAVRLREALGGPAQCPRILIKRDDLTGLGLGGNKARKLEYLIADALAKGAHTVITTGAVQSNHARMTAAAACIAGLRCVLVLTSRHAVPRNRGQPAARSSVRGRSAVRARGRPDARRGSRRGGRRRCRARGDCRGTDSVCHSGRGVEPGRRAGLCVGHRRARRQLEAMERLAVTPVLRQRLARHASRSDPRGKAERAPYALWGVAVSAGEPEKIVRAMNAANEAAALLGVPIRVIDRRSLHRSGLHRRRLRHPDAAGLESIDLLARTEAILLDPVLHGEGLGGPIRHVARRRNPARTTRSCSCTRAACRAVHARVRRGQTVAQTRRARWTRRSGSRLTI